MTGHSSKAACAFGILLALYGCGARTPALPGSGEGATKRITLRSNVNCSYFVDSRLLGKGRELQIQVEDTAHEIHCVADGYRTKIEYANPPFVDHYVVGFTFMIGDKLALGERADVPVEPSVPAVPAAPPSDVIQVAKRSEPPLPRAQTAKAPAPSLGSLYTRRWAAVVGIDTYAELPPLEGASGDARRVAAELRERGFDEVVEIYNTDATRERILNVVGTQLARKTGQDDLVVIYFAGHGETEDLPNGEKRGYVLPVDTKKDDLFSSGISMAQLRDLSARLPAKHVYYVMDSCYSGLGFTRGFTVDAGTPGFIKKVTSMPAVQMLTAGMEGEQAAERGGRGLFTDYFLRALDGEADFDNDGNVTASEIGNYVRPQVTAESQSRQTPQFGTLQGSGEIVFPVRSN